MLRGIGRIGAVGLVAMAGGCGWILGLDEFVDAPPAKPACEDGERSAGETDVDCGGSCQPCPSGKGCKTGPDCESLVCSGGTCLEASCSDQVSNGDESDADCGGVTCLPCADGGLCRSDQDCVSHVCLDGTCAAATCDDTTLNAEETDTDCGGPVCAGCGPGQACALDEDCEARICRSELCVDHHLWTVAFEGDGIQSGEQVLTTSSGSLYLLASLTEGTLDIGSETVTNPCMATQEDPICPQDRVLARLDAAGNHTWHRFINDDNENYYFTSIIKIATTSSEVLVLAHGTGDFDMGDGPLTDPAPCQTSNCIGVDTALVKFDSTGGQIWAKRFQDDDDLLGWDIKASGNTVAIAGCFSGSANLGGGALASSGSRDAFLATFDAAGNHAWSKRFGDSAVQCARAVAVDAAGNAVVAGYFSGSINLGGATLVSAGSHDLFVAKFNSAGSHLWSRRFGDAQDQGDPTRLNTALVAAVDPSGNVFIVGQLKGAITFDAAPLVAAGSASAFIAKLDLDGNPTWSKRLATMNIQSTESVNVKGIDVDPSGALVLTGHATGVMDAGGYLLNPGEFVLKLDAAGVPVWARSFEDASLRGVAAGGVDYLVVTGAASPTADLGGGPIGSGPIFVAKFVNP